MLNAKAIWCVQCSTPKSCSIRSSINLFFARSHILLIWNCEISTNNVLSNCVYIFNKQTELITTKTTKRMKIKQIRIYTKPIYRNLTLKTHGKEEYQCTNMTTSQQFILGNIAFDSGLSVHLLLPRISEMERSATEWSKQTEKEGKGINVVNMTINYRNIIIFNAINIHLTHIYSVQCLWSSWAL